MDTLQVYFYSFYYIYMPPCFSIFWAQTFTFPIIYEGCPVHPNGLPLTNRFRLGVLDMEEDFTERTWKWCCRLLIWFKK